MGWWRAVFGALFLMLDACGGPQLIGRPDMQVVSGADLQPPSRSDLILQQRSYLIGPFDKVAIDVYGIPELSRTVQVDASGKVSLPLVGEIEASGNTPTQLAGLIATQLRGRYVKDPQVTVNTDTVNQTITVDGEVKKPGLYPVTGRMTLMRAVATAEGMTDFAKSDFIVVFRRVNSKDLAALYDMRAIRQGLYADPEVFANDVVYVGESTSARVFQSVIASGGLLAAPLVAVLN